MILRRIVFAYRFYYGTSFGLPPNGRFRAAVKAIGTILFGQRAYISGERWFHAR